MGGWTAIRLVVVLACSTSAVAGCSGDGTTTISTSPTTTNARAWVEHDEWEGVFASAGVTGTFVARQVGSSDTHVWNLERADQRRLPASTFKILNAMVILQTGVVGDVDQLVPWDGVVHDVSVWNTDHSLRTGIEVSAVHMFQTLAREVGADRMAEWVDRAAYGNADIGGGIDQFWLRGDLRISPTEQLDFLERMVRVDLPFDREVVESVREIIVRERGDGWTWSYKTGTALWEEPTLGWLVGTTSYLGDEWVFAMNLDLATDLDLQRQGVGDDGRDVRETISLDILQSLGALPAPL